MIVYKSGELCNQLYMKLYNGETESGSGMGMLLLKAVAQSRKAVIKITANCKNMFPLKIL